MRPAGSPPEWATNATYPSGNPNKIVPGGSQISNGWDPSERPAAQYMNFLEARLAQFATMHDAIEVQNWTVPSTPAVLLAPNLAAVGQSYCLAWDDFRKNYWLVSPDRVVLRSFDGVNWIDEWTGGANGGPVMNACDVSPASGVFYGCSRNFGANQSMNRTAGGAWTTFSNGVNTTVNGVAYDRQQSGYAKPWCFWGQGGTNHPMIQQADDTTASLVSMVLTNGATYTGTVAHCAFGTTRKVALAIVTSPSVQVRQWDTDSFANAWVDRGATSFGSVPKALAYGAADGIFMLTCAAGEVYSSSDGIVWALVTTSGLLFETYCLAALGGIWCASVTLPGSGDRHLAWSIDAGATWIKQPWPGLQATTPYCLIAGDNRFAMAQKVGNAVLQTVYSMRSR